MSKQTHTPQYTAHRGKVRSRCSCGWEAIGLNKSENGASEAFSAHLYAIGVRTAAQSKEAMGL